MHHQHHQIHKFDTSHDAQNFWRVCERRGIKPHQMRTRGFLDSCEVWVYVFPC